MVERRPRGAARFGWTRAVAAAVVAFLALAGISAAPADGPVSPEVDAVWHVPLNGLAASEVVRDGTFLATDYVYDDHGPDVDGQGGGDATYPEGDAYRRNAADLAELRIARAANDLVLGMRLNAVIDPRLAIAAVGIAPPGAPPERLTWPGGAGVAAEGVRWVVSLTADGATVTDLTGDADPIDLPVAVANDAERHLENTYTVRLRAADLGLGAIPESGTWRLHAVSGLRAGDGWARHAAEDAPAPFDAMFVRDEQPANWQQSVQADVLASADLTPAAARLDLAFADTGPPRATGRQTRIYRSAYEDAFGEGIGTWTIQALEPDEPAAPVGDHYLGLFEPYEIWIPPGYEPGTPLPLFLYLHGFGGSHLNLGEWASGGIDVAAFALSALGRAPFGFYTGAGELDVVEALADVRRNYDVDANRIVMSGISMGGQGTYRLAVRYPDLFAAAVPLIGTSNSDRTLTPPPLGDALPDLPAGRQFPGGGFEMLENLANVPLRIYNGQVDWLVNNGFVRGDLTRLRLLDHDHQYAGFTRRHHETVTSYTNMLYHQVLDACRSDAPGCRPDDEPQPIVRDPNPARVVFKTYPEQFYPEYGLVYDGAYWVSGMEVREAATFGMVDATSLGHAAKQRGDAELLGPEVRTFTPTGEPYEWEGLRLAPIAGDAEDRFTATLTGLAGVTFDLPRMAIDRRRFVADLAGDGATAVTFAGPFRAGDDVTVTRDGDPFAAFTVEDGALVVAAELAAEASRFEVTAGAGGAGPPPGKDRDPDAPTGSRSDGGPLPATGGGAGAGAVGLLALAAALGRRLRRLPEVDARLDAVAQETGDPGVVM